MSQTSIMKTSALFVLLISVCSTTNGLDGPSPDSEFLLQPSNVTVPVGEQVILKCKTANKAQLCRWFFLELDLKFFDKRVTPLQVKEFSPAGRQDCSIRIPKVRKVQEGQWLCQALKFQSSKFIMTKPVTVRVITESESVTWDPPKDDNTDLSPRNGRREDGTYDPDEVEGLKFLLTDKDIIQDVFIHETAILKCQVNQPIESCSWVMPNGENLTSTEQEKYGSTNQSNTLAGFKVTGDLSKGNCSLEISNVVSHYEGNWHCLVRTTKTEDDIQGPLLHLHILDHDTASKHTHDGISPTNEDHTNVLIISLVTIAGILFIIVLLLLMFLYRRLKGSHDERQRILQTSPRNSLDSQTKTLSPNDFTSSSVIAVEPRKKIPFNDYHNGYYNQYLDMSGTGSSSGDGYIMMPGSSIRSSTSSRTTLSTLSTLPIGRSRSASNSTTDSAVFPHITTIIDNPSYNPATVTDRRLPQRPDSVYSNDHVYEEIKEKIEEFISKMENIPEVNSPTYSNTTQDHEGYLVPKTTQSNDKPEGTKQNDLPDERRKFPLPNSCTDNDKNIQPKNELGDRPPYSVVGPNGLIPASGNNQELPPGYSKVGEGTQTQYDPMESYDIPRPMPAYDVPKPNPSPINSQSDSALQNTISVDGLSGIIV